MNVQDPSSTEARLLILETSVAALIAQLPPHSLQEVAGMLDFVAEAAEDVEEVIATTGGGQLHHIHHWASEMLQRVMVSRKVFSPEQVRNKLRPSVPRRGVVGGLDA